MLNLMAKPRKEEAVSFLHITHDITSARYLADRALVMYAGHTVEQGQLSNCCPIPATPTLLSDPRHPYTQLLLQAAPSQLAACPVDRMGHTASVEMSVL